MNSALWPARFGGGGGDGAELSPSHSREPSEPGGSRASIPSTRDTSPTSSIRGVATGGDTWVGRALFDFRPDDQVEVELRAGDLIQVFPHIACADGWIVVTNQGQTGLVPASYVGRTGEPDKPSRKEHRRGGHKDRSERGLLIDSRDKSKQDLDMLSVDALQSELELLDAQLEKDLATVKLRYARRRQQLEAAMRGAAPAAGR